MKHLKLLNVYDYFLLILFVLITIILFILFNKDGSMGANVSIFVNGSLYQELPLNINEEIEINDGTHINRIKIENGTAYMMEANCPDELCLNTNHISKSNEIIVCLPNKVYIEINDDNSTNEIDGFVN